MKCVAVKPFSPCGWFTAPPSKSESHRLLILAALSQTPAVINGLSRCADVAATIRCLRALGASIFFEGDSCRVTPSSLKRVPYAELVCGESGSTLRFLLPACLLLAEKAVFSGSGRLPTRPISGLIKALEDNGARFSGHALPFCAGGRLKNGDYIVPGGVSSQYISGLVMSLPLLNGPSRILLNSGLVSTGYVDITLYAMRRFGVQVQRAQGQLVVPGPQRYLPVAGYRVEGDWSGASYLFAAAAISGSVACAGLPQVSLQPDRRIIELVRAFGAKAHWQAGRAVVAQAQLHGADIDVSGAPDLFPALAVIGAAARGKTVLYNAEGLRLKESDRLSAMEDTLNRLGANARAYPDRLEIYGCGRIKGGHVDGRGDHRIVMAAAAAAAASESEIIINGADAIEKSYPKFFDDYRRIGGKAYVL